MHGECIYFDLQVALKYIDEMDNINANEFAVALEGFEVTPESVDTVLLLRIANEYLRTMLRVADDEGMEISFHGLRIEKGSACVVATTNDAVVTKEVSRRTNELLRDPKPPSYFTSLIESIESLSALEYSLYVANDNWREAIEAKQKEEPFAVEETVRVIVLRAGGVAPAIRVENVLFPDRKFTIKTTQAEAIELSRFLYREIEVRITARSDGDNYSDARLIEYDEVDETGSAIEAWAKWYESTGAMA